MRVLKNILREAEPYQERNGNSTSTASLYGTRETKKVGRGTAEALPRPTLNFIPTLKGWVFPLAHYKKSDEEFVYIGGYE
jgi:hypothetical protein